MIDYIENTKEAQEFIVDRLKDVKELLDEIAQETGIVYVAVPCQELIAFTEAGTQLSAWYARAMQVIADRQVLANDHTDFMYAAHPERMAEKVAEHANKQNGKQNGRQNSKKLTPADIAETVTNSQKDLREVD